MLQFGEHSNGNEIELHVGEEFVIILHENPTTGFHWNPISSGEPVCKLLDNSFDPTGNVPGNGGNHSWHFKAVKEGSSKIEYAYRRSWEQDRPAAQIFTLNTYCRA
jgi:inhibitor of cysteine peptidase